MTLKELKKIKEYAKNKKWDKSHDINHLERVKNNSLKLVEILEIKDQVDSVLLQAICYLHDLTYTKHKAGFFSYVFEGKLVKRLLKKELKNFSLDLFEKEIIINSISKHPHSFPFKRLNKKEDLYTKLLQDADTIDLFHTLRVNQSTQRLIKIPFFRKFLTKKYLNFGLKNLEKYLNFTETCATIKTLLY